MSKPFSQYTEAELKPVRIYHTNKTGGSLVHGPIIDPETGKPALDEDDKQIEFKLGPGESITVPQFVADIWLTHSHYNAPICALTPDEVSPAQDKIKAERDALAAENAELSQVAVGAAERIAALEKLVNDLKAQTSGAPVIEGTPLTPDELAAKAKEDAALAATSPAKKTAKPAK